MEIVWTSYTLLTFQTSDAVGVLHSIKNKKGIMANLTPYHKIKIKEPFPL